jgi:hypothetical protein
MPIMRGLWSFPRQVLWRQTLWRQVTVLWLQSNCYFGNKTYHFDDSSLCSCSWLTVCNDLSDAIFNSHTDAIGVAYRPAAIIELHAINSTYALELVPLSPLDFDPWVWGEMVNWISTWYLVHSAPVCWCHCTYKRQWTTCLDVNGRFHVLVAFVCSQ